MFIEDLVGFAGILVGDLFVARSGFVIMARARSFMGLEVQGVLSGGEFVLAPCRR